MTDHKTDSRKSATAVSDAFLEHQTFLKKFLGRYFSRPQDIEDVAQEAFLKAYRAEKTQDVRAPKSFIFHIAKNVALQQLTKKSQLITDYIEDLANPQVVYEQQQTSSVEDTVVGHQKLAVFCEAVASLPPQCRKTFLMRKVYGLSHKEISKKLGIAISTVEKHQAIGLKRCSEFMRNKGWTDADMGIMPTRAELKGMSINDITAFTGKGQRDGNRG